MQSRAIRACIMGVVFLFQIFSPIAFIGNLIAIPLPFVHLVFVLACPP